MGDLISRNELLDEIKYYQMDIVAKATAMTVIRNAPTVDAKPVVHGEWIDDTGFLDSVRQYKCSECEERPILSSNWRTLLTDFCPNCGADMRKKVNDD